MNNNDFIAKMIAERIIDGPVTQFHKGDQSEIFKFKEHDKNHLIKIVEYPIFREIREKLEILSNKKLIPTIHAIGINYIIMDEINGKSLLDIYKTLSDEQICALYSKIKNVINIWQENGFCHGDIHSKNIIISENSIILIDPCFYSQSSIDNDNRMLNETFIDMLGKIRFEEIMLQAGAK